MKNKKIIIFTLLGLIIVALTVILVGNYSRRPEKIVVGENNYSLGNYVISSEGFDGIKKIIDSSEKMKKNYTVSYFEAELSKEGKLENFNISLNVFDNNLKYVGRANYTYNNNKLTYAAPVDDNIKMVISYDKNSDITYLGNMLKKIPLKGQIRASELNHYFISYQPYTKIDEGTPIFDGRNNDRFKVLSKKEYNAGKGGISDGKTSVVFKLDQGQGTTNEEKYLYVFKPIDEKTALGNIQSMMEIDYYLNNGSLKFTRDYGGTWIDVDIDKELLRNTQNFFKNNLSLEPNSWFIAKDKSLPIAFFYGAEPVLRISNDNGNLWRDYEFPKSDYFGRAITKRVIGFTTSNTGYAALGTDWSMGAGENKKCYFTNDGGQTWLDKDLPLQGKNNTLNDMFMFDDKSGLVVLDGGMEVYFPVVYITTNAGDSWQEIRLPYEDVPLTVQYLIDVDKVTYENGSYNIIMGQADKDIKKVIFKAKSLMGPWKFDTVTEKNVHMVG